TALQSVPHIQSSFLSARRNRLEQESLDSRGLRRFLSFARSPDFSPMLRRQVREDPVSSYCFFRQKQTSFCPLSDLRSSSESPICSSIRPSDKQGEQWDGTTEAVPP